MNLYNISIAIYLKLVVNMNIIYKLMAKFK